MRKLDYTTIFFALMGSFLFLFILIPILNLMLSANLGSIVNNLQDPNVLSAIFISVYCALAATIIALLFGVPLAYILARHDFAGKGFIEAVIDVPIVIPHTVSGIALLLVFTSTGIIGAPLGQLGIVFTDAIPGIIIAMLFASGSFVVNSAREGFENVDPRMEKVARTLGSNSLRTFGVITLPLAMRNIRSNCNHCLLPYYSSCANLQEICRFWAFRGHSSCSYFNIFMSLTLPGGKIDYERMENL